MMLRQTNFKYYLNKLPGSQHLPTIGFLLWVIASHLTVYLIACTGFFLLVWLFCPRISEWEHPENNPELTGTDVYTVYLWFPKFVEGRWKWLDYGFKFRPINGSSLQWKYIA